MNTLRVVKPIRALQSVKFSRAFSVPAARMANEEKSTLDADKGSIGAQFEADGKIGEKAQQVGGIFDKNGSVGKEFNSDGKVGSTAQAAAEQAQGDKKPMFDKNGIVGRNFQGSIGEKIGGPFSKDGVIGKNFTDKGSVGGSVQENLGDKK